MNEAFYPIFLEEKREQVEFWYNMVATGCQRNQFRRICNEIFVQDPNKADPTYAASYTAIVDVEDARLILKYYGLVLSEDIGKPRARTWLLHIGTNHRIRDEFRSCFTGCQTEFRSESVMHKDYQPPEEEHYLKDRTHFVRSVDWSSIGVREKMKLLEEHRRSMGGVNVSTLDKRASQIAEERLATLRPRERVTKPKNQFDGVNVLTTLGYTETEQEEAVKQLKAKVEADRQVEQYYVDADGCTVYKARATHGQAGRANGTSAPGDGGILSTVTSEPIARWVTKTCS